MKWLIATIVFIAQIFAATASPEYLADLKAYMTSKPFEIKGIMYAYDFDGDGIIEYKDWVYESAKTGKTWRLLGKAPTPTNAFGFKRVNIDLAGLEPSGYFVFLGFKKDERKFSWAYVSVKTHNVYKLMGATPQHHFSYIKLLDMTYQMEDGKIFFVYRYEDFPNIIGSYDTPGFSWRVKIDGDLAFVADGETGIEILDISNPVEPTLYANIPTFNALDLTIAGPLLLIADDKEGLVIASKEKMKRTCTLGLPHNAHATSIAYNKKKNIAFIGSDEAGAWLFQPAKDEVDLLQNLPSQGIVTRVRTRDSKIYVGDGDAGIHIYKIGPSKHIEFLQEIPAFGINDFVLAKDGKIFLSRYGKSQIEMIDSNGQISSFDNDEIVGRIVLSPDKKRLYVLNKVASVTVYNVENMPQKIGKIYLPYPATDMKVSRYGTYGYVTCGGDGFKILKLR